MRYVLKVSSADSVLIHSGIKGMRWGIRRYQNEDGSLTDAGKKRYSSAKKKEMDSVREKAYNNAVKLHLLKNPGDTAGAKAAGRQASKDATATHKINEAELKKKTLDDAVKKDLDSTNTILKEGANAAGTAANVVRNIRVNVPRMDLSNMTDKEMRERIQREQLESQYDQMFNTKRHAVENGKARVAGILDGVKGGLALGTSALAIALAVKQLKG